MRDIKQVLIIILYLAILCLTSASHGFEQSIHGLVDIRANSTDSFDGYLQGGYGKFHFSDGSSLSLAQLGLNYQVTWDNDITLKIVANAYVDGVDDALGITEGFLSYKSLPNSNGLRYRFKAGVFYPSISLENNATAWTSSDMLSFSTLNTWIGEEVRVQGVQAQVTHLGKFSNSKHDLTVGAAVFNSNDPTGALLSWHGWTLSNRQTFWQEKRPLPHFPAIYRALASQALESDPFKEIDNRLGYHLFTQWRWTGKGKLLLGYYNNRGEPYRVTHGQYSWKTRFFHIGGKWRLPNNYTFTIQYLTGDTLMQNHSKIDMVNNDYHSAFFKISKKWQKHRLTGRIEEFAILDNDNTWGDNNQEYGKAATFNYTYRFKKNWFLSTEFSWINSARPSRNYQHLPVQLIERQWLFAARYFFAVGG